MMDSLEGVLSLMGIIFQTAECRCGLSLTSRTSIDTVAEELSGGQPWSKCQKDKLHDWQLLLCPDDEATLDNQLAYKNIQNE